MSNQSITATCQGDSLRFNRYILDPDQEVAGILYLPKDKPLPDTVTIELILKPVKLDS